MFFRKELPALGWAEETTRRDQQAALALTFDKAGVRLSVSGRRQSPTGPTRVTLRVMGNVDARSLPRPPDAVLTANSYWVIAYTCKSGRAEVAALLRKEMAARNWREVADAAASKEGAERRIALCFWCNAMEVIVAVGENREGQTEVSYLVQVQEGLKP